MTSEEISLVEVHKVFHVGVLKKKTAVAGLSLSIPRGEVVGLLGANGSGKSTTIKMILGFLKPSSGHIHVCGLPAGTAASRRLIGYLPENPRFQRFLTATEILSYYGRLHGLSGQMGRARVAELLEMVGLGDAGGEKVSGFSKGMTQRLAIAQALLNRPKLLIFDEPMSGLDPLGRREIRALIRRICEELPDSTLFFSSHILEDVESLCSSVALLKQGRLQNFCRVRDLLQNEPDLFSIVVENSPPALAESLRTQHGAIHTPLGLGFTLSGSETLIAKLSDIRRHGGQIVSINSRRVNLEEALFADGTVKSTELRPRSIGRTA